MPHTPDPTRERAASARTAREAVASDRGAHEPAASHCAAHEPGASECAAPEPAPSDCAAPGTTAPAPDRPRIRVVAAALYDSQGRILIADRPPGKAMAGRWEFPGGKIAPGESEHGALVRELHEELGVRIHAARPFMRIAHDYAELHVELSLWIVERYDGEPRGLDGQRLKWVPPAQLSGEDILEADRPFVEALGKLAVAIP